MRIEQLDRRLDSILIAVGRLQGTTSEHANTLERLHDDLRSVNLAIAGLSESVARQRTNVAVLNWKLIMVAAMSGGAGSMLLCMLGG